MGFYYFYSFFFYLSDTFYTEIKTLEKMKTKLHAHVYSVVQNILSTHPQQSHDVSTFKPPLSLISKERNFFQLEFLSYQGKPGSLRVKHFV